MNYEEYGGSPLLGLKGLCLICHGRSSAKAIKNAILQAERMIDSRLIETIGDALAKKGNTEVDESIQAS